MLIDIESITQPFLRAKIIREEIFGVDVYTFQASKFGTLFADTMVINFHDALTSTHKKVRTRRRVIKVPG